MNTILLVMNAVALLVIAGVFLAFKEAGPVFAAGFVVGFVFVQVSHRIRDGHWWDY